MMDYILLLIFFGFLVGGVLGLTGAGGSIFALPLLVYGASLEVHQAISLSVIVVGLTAMIGAFQQIYNKRVDLTAVAILAVGGLLGAPLGTAVGIRLSGTIIMEGFALILLFVGISMWFKKDNETDSLRPSFSNMQIVMLLIGSFISSFLTGIFGIGGGFLIVPLLVFIGLLPMKSATASSLCTIALFSFYATLSRLEAGFIPSLNLIFPLVGGGILGITSGTYINRFLSNRVLQRGFALLTISLALFIIFTHPQVK